MRFFLIIQFALWSNIAFSGRYGIYDDPEYYGSGGVGIFDVLGAIGATIFSFWFIFSSYNEWKARQATGKKIERSDFIADIVAPIFGYSLAAFFLSFPLVIFYKLVGGEGSLMDTWLLIGLICFGVVTFLRQT